MDLTAQLIAFLGAAPIVVGKLLLLALVALVALRIGTLGADRIIRAVLDREAGEGTSAELSAIELHKRSQTLHTLVVGTLRFFIVVIAFITALDVLGLDVGPAVAGVGVAGIAIGFGAQSLVKDFLAGAFILIENQYARGDTVKIADVTGTVEAFTLRRTTLRDLDGTVHTVPNGLIGVSSNLTRVWARINLDLTVPYETDLERATNLVDEVGREMAGDDAWRSRILEPPRVERIESLSGGVTLKVLGSVRAADRWAASSELRRRVLRSFAGAGIRLGPG